MEYYPKITAFLFFCVIGVIMSFLVPNFRRPVMRNRLQHDYAHISKHYSFQASQIDHWCLWGGDDQCTCLDFTEPESNSHVAGWLKAHEANKKNVEDAVAKQSSYKPFDVVFVGDEMVEKMGGKQLGMADGESQQVGSLFKKSFEAGDFGWDVLYLGIAGDQVSQQLRGAPLGHSFRHCAKFAVLQSVSHSWTRLRIFYGVFSTASFPNTFLPASIGFGPVATICDKDIAPKKPPSLVF